MYEQEEIPHSFIHSQDRPVGSHLFDLLLCLLAASGNGLFEGQDVLRKLLGLINYLFRSGSISGSDCKPLLSSFSAQTLSGPTQISGNAYYTSRLVSLPALVLEFSYDRIMLLDQKLVE